MIEKIQFWAVLSWMIGMLVMAVFAIRAVWLEADHGPGETDSNHDSRDRNPSGSGTDQGASGSVEPR